MTLCCAIGMAGLVVAPPATLGPERPCDFAWFAEGESSIEHTWSATVLDSPDYAPCYGGGMLVCAKDEDPPGGAYDATLTAKVDEPGTYALWVAATPPGAGSPLRVTVDDYQPVEVTGAARFGTWGPGGCFTWMEALTVGLAAGEHKVTVGVTAKREFDGKHYAYLDAVALEQVGDDAAAPLASLAVLPIIDKTPIRFYSGNASVGLFMQYWGTGQPGNTGAIDQALIDLLKRCGCTAHCDYQAWCCVEQDQGKWDWSFYRANAQALRAAGLAYNVFCWLHYPPRWFMETPDYVPYKCLEHGQALNQLSLWAPSTKVIYEDYYRRLASEFGEEVGFLRLSMPSEYGEIGYPIGMTTWLVPQAHVHGGFWCGDEPARADFRRFAAERYGGVAGVNAAWGTAFASQDDVSPPNVVDYADARKALASRSPSDLRRWLDFVDWYEDSQGDFATWATRLVKSQFTGKEIILSLGYGAEPVAWGNDESRHIKRLAEVGASAQTPGDIGYLPCRRVSTACRVYGVPYYTEPPGSVDRNREARRLFIDISNGTQTFFDYPQNMDGARDLLAEALPSMGGAPPVCDVAFMLPSSWWWCHPEWQWPPRTTALAEAVRDRMDYEVVDELMVRDGALEKLGIRVLVLAEGDFMEARALAAIEEWVQRGGVLAVLGVPALPDIDGDLAVSSRLLPDTPPAADDLPTAWSARNDVGAGHVVALPFRADPASYAHDLVALTYDLADLDPTRPNAKLIDDADDGIWATLLPDRIVYFNTTGHLVRKRVPVRAEDWAGEAPADTEIVLPAHRMAAVTYSPQRGGP